MSISYSLGAKIGVRQATVRQQRGDYFTLHGEGILDFIKALFEQMEIKGEMEKHLQIRMIRKEDLIGHT